MIQILLTLFVIMFAPIPWIIVAIHILVANGRWNSIASKALVIIVSTLVWSLLGYWIFSNNEVLFANKLDSNVAQIGGIIVLLVATAIEFLTRKALGVARIFGSSEFKQTKDKLVTNGIYKYARHPRYLEHPLWALGLGLTFGYTSFLWFFIYMLIGFALVAYFEEKELIKRYGEQYLEYKRKVPAFFIWGKK